MIATMKPNDQLKINVATVRKFFDGKGCDSNQAMYRWLARHGYTGSPSTALGVLLGTSPSPSVWTVYLIAKTMGLTVEDLVTDDELPTETSEETAVPQSR